MADLPRLSRYQQISDQAAQMLALGESGRFEFKSDVDAVHPKVLASLANAVALDPDREVAQLLVGVDEVEDPQTGLVSGVPCGLAKGLDKAVSRIQSMAALTRPVPVGVFIVEEAVASEKPFIRVEVWPTAAPHFDDEGRRQTRQGRSTRALTDDELLSIYLDREASSFATRFRYAGEELQAAVGSVGAQVDEIAAAIDEHIAQPLADLIDSAESAQMAAMSAESAASDAGYETEKVARLVRDLRSVVDELQDDTTQQGAVRVADVRRKVWWALTVDTWERSSVQAERLARRYQSLLSTDIAVDAALNAWEFRIWEDVLSDRESLRDSTGTLKWWSETAAEVESYLERPVFQGPELPDLRAELRADFDRAVDDPESLTNRFKTDLR